MAAFADEGGRTADQIAEPEVVTYDGERVGLGKTSEEQLDDLIMEGRPPRAEPRRPQESTRQIAEIREKFPDIPRRVSGYNPTSSPTHAAQERAGKPQFRPPRLARRAILQGHCHQRMIMKMSGEMSGEEEVLRQMGLRVTTPEEGCCAMARAFGFERGERYEVSMRCGQRALLPEVRRASMEPLVIDDGFSCREKIRQGTAREALRLAQVLRMVMTDGPERPPRSLPEALSRETAECGPSKSRGGAEESRGPAPV